MQTSSTLKFGDIIDTLLETQDKLKILERVMSVLGPYGNPDDKDELYKICRDYWQRYLDFDDSE